MKKDKSEPFFFIVVGVHKAGTTTLYKQLKGHPDFYSPFKKEMHFFTPMIYGESIDDLGKYYLHFKKREDQQFLLDISPSYLYGENSIPAQLKKLDRPVKCLVILRNPTDRFVSFYKQAVKTGNISKSETLHEYFLKCKREFDTYISTKEKKDNFYNRGLREGCYSLYLPNWLNIFEENFKVIFFEELTETPSAVFNDIFDWVGVNSNFDKGEFRQENRSFKPRFQIINKWVTQIYKKNEEFFRENSIMTNWLKTLYGYINKTEYTDEELNEKDQINDFYSPFNERLKEILPAHEKVISKWNSENPIYS